MTERYRFGCRRQREQESIADYVADLRRLAMCCDFKLAALDETLRDRFICGLSEEYIRSKLLTESDDLKFDTAVQMVYTLPSTKVPPIKIQVMANRHDIEMELDTGAAVSLMSERTFHKIFKNELELKPSTVILRSYSGHRLEVLGVVDLTITHHAHHAQTARLPLVVVTGDGPSLLGRNWLQLIKLDWGSIKTISLSRGYQETHTPFSVEIRQTTRNGS